MKDRRRQAHRPLSDLSLSNALIFSISIVKKKNHNAILMRLVGFGSDHASTGPMGDGRPPEQLNTKIAVTNC